MPAQPTELETYFLELVNGTRMFRWRQSKWRGYDPGVMPVVERAIVEEYQRHLEAQSWSCVALLACVALLQERRPDLSQSAAISLTIEIIRRAREADGLG
jgi:hypothetical protein